MRDNIFSQIGTYGVGTFLTKAVSFFLIPIYAANLNPTEFGQLAIARIAPAFLMPIFTLNLHGAIIRMYLDWENKKNEKSAIFTITIFSLIWSAIMMCCTIAFGHLIFPILIKAAPFDPYIKIAIIAEGITAISTISYKLMRIKEQAKLFSIVSFVETTMVLLSVIYFIVSRQMGVLGALYGILLANSIMMLIHFIYLVINSSLSINLKALRESINYSLPLVPGNIVESFYSVLDRFFMDKFIPLNQIGLYSFGQRISQILLIVINVLQLGFAPFFIRLYSKSNNYVNTMGYYYKIFAYVICITAVSICIFASELVAILGTSNYAPAHSYIYLIVLSLTVHSFGFFGSNQIALAKKTIYESYISFIKLFLFATLGYFGILNFGIYGVLITYIVINSLTTTFLIYIGQKKNRIFFPFYTLITVISLIVIFCLFFAVSNEFFYANFIIFKSLIFLVICYFIYKKLLNSLKILKEIDR